MMLDLLAHIINAHFLYIIESLNYHTLTYWLYDVVVNMIASKWSLLQTDIIILAFPYILLSHSMWMTLISDQIHTCCLHALYEWVIIIGDEWCACVSDEISYCCHNIWFILIYHPCMRKSKCWHMINGNCSS